MPATLQIIDAEMSIAFTVNRYLEVSPVGPTRLPPGGGSKVRVIRRWQPRA
jgi:hypothetical protein